MDRKKIVSILKKLFFLGFMAYCLITTLSVVSDYNKNPEKYIYIGNKQLNGYLYLNQEVMLKVECTPYITFTDFIQSRIISAAVVFMIIYAIIWAIDNVELLEKVSKKLKIDEEDQN